MTHCDIITIVVAEPAMDPRHHSLVIHCSVTCNCSRSGAEPTAVIWCIVYIFVDICFHQSRLNPRWLPLLCYSFGFHPSLCNTAPFPSLNSRSVQNQPNVIGVRSFKDLPSFLSSADLLRSTSLRVNMIHFCRFSWPRLVSQRKAQNNDVIDVAEIMFPG